MVDRFWMFKRRGTICLCLDRFSLPGIILELYIPGKIIPEDTKKMQNFFKKFTV